jgi:hypothetical protein
MSSSPIRTLKPNVTQEEAVRTFSALGLSSLYWRMRIGPLQKIAGAYVPFRFYRVRYDLGRTPHTRLFALDAVDGSCPSMAVIAWRPLSRKIAPLNCCAKKSCVSFFSKASSSFATSALISHASPLKSIFLIGLVFTVAEKRCVAASWMPSGAASKAPRLRHFSNSGSLLEVGRARAS